MANIFTAPLSTSQQMADSLPVGKVWGSKNIDDSNTRKLINSLAVAHNRAQQQIELISTEFDIDNTVDLLTDWETSVGIPDDCSEGVQTIAQRRTAVKERLRKTPTVTLQDMQDYIDVLFPDTNIVLYAGVDYLGAVAHKEFYVVANIIGEGEKFEYTFEYTFEAGGVEILQLQCAMEKILPSNVILHIVYT